jgi:hypothetical protein
MENILSTEEENKFYNPEDTPACNPDNSCEIIQDFLQEGDELDKFTIFRSLQNDYYNEIYQCQNRIQSYKQKIKAEVQDIIAYKQKLDEAFDQYLN